MIYASMTSSAKKVYDAVPILEKWSDRQIFAEMKRLKLGLDFHMVGGCLNSLISAGLVREIDKGEFRRIAVRVAPEKITLPEKDKNEMKPILCKPFSELKPEAIPLVGDTSVDKLGKLAEIMIGFSERMRFFGTEISNVALEIQQELENKDGSLEKLRQLQSLLKNL